MAETIKGDPIDASVSIKTDEQYMAAFLTVLPAKNGGKDITLPAVLDQLALNGIRFGLNDETLHQMYDQKLYNTSICVARGTPASDGEDGSIYYRFEASDALAPKEDENGIVDYKDLGMVQNIHSEAIIAEIIPPTDGVPGTDIRGIPILAVPGKPAHYSIGNGTKLVDDDRKIVAAVDGNLRWSKDRFVVDDVVVINGDVDTATGNIDFIGNVVIKGDVCDNFTVISKKDVTINGNVTSAHIISDGSINIKLGSINSNLEAGGDIKCGFCESSKIHSRGNLSSSSFVACDILCEGEMSTGSGKGAIIGGRITCLQNITVNSIGSETYTKTYITLGNFFRLSDEKIAIQQKLDSLKAQMKKLIQIVEVLTNEKHTIGALTREREEMLTSSMKMKFATQGEHRRQSLRMAQIDAELSNRHDLKLTCKKDLWPGVTIRIQNETKNIEHHEVRCEAKLSEASHEIEVTPMVK